LYLERKIILIAGKLLRIRDCLRGSGWANPLKICGFMSKASQRILPNRAGWFSFKLRL